MMMMMMVLFLMLARQGALVTMIEAASKAESPSAMSWASV